jgi:hypothetical protein
MKTIIILGALLLTVSMHMAQAGTEGESRTDFPAIRFSFACNSFPWSCSNLLSFCTSRAKVSLAIDRDVLVDPATGQSRDPPITGFGFGDIEMKYLVSWALCFLDAHATFDGKALHVGRSDTIPTNDMAFQCHTNRDPRWASEQRDLLKQLFTYESPAATVPCDQLLAFLLNKARVQNYIIRPDARISDRQINLQPQSGPIGELLDEVCKRAGLKYDFVGGVMLFTPGQTKELHNKAVERD